MCLSDASVFSSVLPVGLDATVKVSTSMSHSIELFG
jgi:hypothetical protein